MKKTEISVKENRQHSSGRVPFSYYESKIPTLFPYVPLHWHNEWELNVITDGEGTFRLNEQEVFVKEGDVLLIQPRVLHAMETTKRLYYDTVVFRTEMLGMQEERSYTEIVLPFCTGQEKILPITPGCPYYDNMRASAETVVRCARENTAVSDILMKSELLRLLWCLRRSDATKTEEVVLKSEEVHHAIAYMTAHYTEPLNIEEIAGSVHLSKSYFMQRFRETVGMGAMEYLNRLRIQMVCERILAGEGIAGAAFACGFRNLSNFNRLFKAEVGCTPGAYRKSGVHIILQDMPE